MEQRHKINRTVKRAMDILNLLRIEGRPMTIKEISAALKIPMTSAFDIVHTLQVCEYLQSSDKNAKTYIIGIKAFETGFSYLLNTNLAKIAQPYVEKIVQETNATAFLALYDRNEILYLNKLEAMVSIRTSAVLGSRRSMYCTGLGKAILAHLPEEQVRRIFAESNVQAHTEHTITSIDALLEELRLTRKRGYAIDNRENDIDILCVAHAIKDYTSSPIAAISTAMLFTPANEAKIEKYGAMIAKYAFEISRQMGYNPEK